MAIDDNVVDELGAVLTDSGGQYRFRVVKGENGKEAMLLSYEQAGKPDRFLVVRGFCVRQLVDSALRFMARDRELERRYQLLARELGVEVPPPMPPPIPEAQRRMMPWQGKRGRR